MIIWGEVDYLRILYFIYVIILIEVIEFKELRKFKNIKWNLNEIRKVGLMKYCFVFIGNLSKE